MITRKEFLRVAAGIGLSTAFQPRSVFGQALSDERPNILWLSCEDIGPHLGCYGDPHSVTPNLDRLATQGVRYTSAFTTAGVCAPNRSCIITGMYSTTLGTHHMRSGGEGGQRSVKPALPPEVKCFSEYLRQAGYYCTNNAKEDYNFPTPASAWDESSAKAHWRNRSKPEQPFFAVFNYTGTHEGSIRATPPAYTKTTARLRENQRQDPRRITPPPFHPDTPVVRRQWANYYECITALDYWVADGLQQLEDDGLAENTIVFFWSDHGAGLTRCKRWVYDSGTHIPLIVRIPESRRPSGQGRPGTVEERLVSSIDFAPTVLNLAGLPIPRHLQGQPFLGPNLPAERRYVYAARDRMDERYDIIRMVRDGRYQYVRNYEPFKPYDQYMDYEEQSPLKVEIHRMAKEGRLPAAAAWTTAKSKPVEELYDTYKDPYEVTNLAGAPECRPILEHLREAHEKWFRETNDLGWIPEPELVVIEKKYGNRYAIWPGLDTDAPDFREQLRSVVLKAGRPAKPDLPGLLAALRNPHAAIRYWAATGIGNLGPENGSGTETLTRAMEDASPMVRVVAAKWLLQAGRAEEKALSVLTTELANPSEWVRLQAALALDCAGEKARPAIPALKSALNDADSKYVVRVATHALGEFQGHP
jgi:uncharacterized sulfatase